MKKWLWTFLHLIIVGLLTLLSQVGGLVWLSWIPLYRFLNKRLKSSKGRWPALISAFVLYWCLWSFLLIPLLAKPFGRVPLPVWSEQTVKPLNMGFCLLNRHYVKPKLKELVLEAGEKMQAQYPGTVLAYLDGCLPFYDGFPLLPHLSHKDGRKLDLAFFFKDKQTKEALNRVTPTWIAYGGSELPRQGEYDQAAICDQKGYWQYSWMYRNFPQDADLVFDAERTRAMIRIFAKQAGIGKILLEPHIKSRLRLSNQKIRFHGCHAVRHDDHVHIQL